MNAGEPERTSHKFDGRTRCAGEPERAAQACLQPNAIGENAGEPQVRRAHSVRTGERVARTRASHKFDGRTRCAGEPERAAQACLQPNAIGENAGEHAGFDDSARSAEAP